MAEVLEMTKHPAGVDDRSKMGGDWEREKLSSCKPERMKS